MGTENIDQGPATITFDGVDMGLTQGGITFTVDTQSRDVNVDQFGDTPVSSLITARTVTIGVPLVETTKENMALFLPGASAIIGTAPVTRIDVQSGVGTNLRAIAKRMVIHPISMDNDPTPDRLDIIIYNAATQGNVSFQYDSQNERVFDLEFTGYATTTDPLFSMGSLAAV